MSTLSFHLVLVGPKNETILQILNRHILLAHGPVPNRDPRSMDGLRITTHKRMPPSQASSLLQPPICTRPRQPAQRPHRIRRQLNAVRNLSQSPRIIPATRSTCIEQTARHVGPIKVTGVFLFQLVQTTLAATVTERLPLGSTHLIESLRLPKRPRQPHPPIKKTARLDPARSRAKGRYLSAPHAPSALRHLGRRHPA